MVWDGQRMGSLLLAGDVGATKTDLAILKETGSRAPLALSSLATANYSSPAALASEFLNQADLSVDRAVFAVAGPVADERVAATLTHLPWEVDGNQLQAAMNLKSVKLINDVEALALSIPHLTPGDLYTLHAGQAAPKGARAVIAVGTGLGEAFLIWDGTRYRACVSEGGHASFAPSTPFEVDLLRHVQRSFDHVSYELVCSGMGLPNVYNCLKKKGYADEPAWLSEKLAAAKDPTPVIVAAALDTDAPCDIAVAALDRFVSILGSQAGNLALTVMATGGVYLGGGIPPRMLAALGKESFAIIILCSAFVKLEGKS